MAQSLLKKTVEAGLDEDAILEGGLWRNESRSGSSFCARCQPVVHPFLTKRFPADERRRSSSARAR
jgi:hypothetical protein